VRVIALLALLAAGCRPSQLCPAGMQLVTGDAAGAQSFWCKSKDGRVAQWVEIREGHRRQVCLYENGQPHGPFLGYHPDGSRWIEGAFRDGVKEGAWNQWDKRGSPVADAEYRRGRLVGGAPVGMAARCEEMHP
jgi:hypothetical protein